MTTQIPLHYLSHPVGHALVDPPLGDLPRSIHWSLSVPHASRRLYHNRPDVLLAALREDDVLRTRCHPFIQLRQAQRRVIIRLSRVACRHEIVTLLRRFKLSIDPTQKETLLDEIVSLSLSVVRVVFVNSNRLDCRLSNMREVGLADDDASVSETYDGLTPYA